MLDEHILPSSMLHTVVVLVSVQGVQNGGLYFKITRFERPPFLVYTFKDLLAFLYECIYIIIIHIILQITLFGLSIWDCDYWYVFTYLEFQT